MLFDLGLFRAKAKAAAADAESDGTIPPGEALVRCAIYVALALGFNLLIYRWHGRDAALEFLAGYLIEQSLSVDNLFVFIMLFTYFSVSPRHQQKVLFWGIIGALVMRGIFIYFGVALIQRFEWIIYVFGAMLVYSGYKMAFSSGEEVHPERNIVLKVIRRFVPITPNYEGDRFFVRKEGYLLATPLVIVLVVIETTDLVFAVDSIPAIMAISKDPFIIYTSNVFAILGLRAMFFALSGVMGLFHLLKYGLSAILVFVGVKMLISHYYHMHVALALGVVAGILTISVAASLLLPEKPKAPHPPE